jgi:hypothetical protein
LISDIGRRLLRPWRPLPPPPIIDPAMAQTFSSSWRDRMALNSDAKLSSRLP